MDYEDFVVRIGSVDDDGKHLVQVLASPAGEGEDRLELPEGVTLCEITAGTSTAEDVGGRLFRALFNGQIGTLFYESLGEIGRDETRGLRIKLRLHGGAAEAGPLQELPWELLYQESRGFLSLSRTTPLVRHLEVRRDADRPPVELPLRVLVLTAQPSGVGFLDVDGETRQILEALEELDDVEHVVATASTPLDLREVLLAGPPFHVLHFIGHGTLDETTGCGQLLFGTAGNPPVPVDGATLALALNDFPTLRMVVLNACETARPSRRDSLNGVAGALVTGAIPAVVAMQRRISDDAAIAFSRALYRRLAAGDAIETAVTEGRHAIRDAASDAAEWATPVLFLRAADSRLFAPRATGEPNSEPTNSANVAAALDDRSRRRGVSALAGPLLALLLLLLGGLLAGAATWRRPTRVELELLTRRIAFTVGADEPREILSASVGFRDLAVDGFDHLSLRPTSLTWSDGSDPASWHILSPPGAVRLRPRANEHGGVFLSPRDPAAVTPLGVLDRIWAAPDSRAVLETDAIADVPLSGEPSLTFELVPEKDIAIVIFEDLEISTDFTDLEGVDFEGVELDDSEPRPGGSSTYRVRMTEPYRRIDICCEHGGLRFVVTPDTASRTTLFNPGSLPVTDIDLLEQGLTGEVTSALLANGLLRYPDAPGLEAVVLQRHELIGLEPQGVFQLLEITLDEVSGGLRLVLSGTATSIRGSADGDRVRDHRLTLLDHLVHARR